VIKRRICKGYDLYNLYQYLFSSIMFNSRYKYVNNKLLKRYMLSIYLKTIGVKK
jgi:hypothetical protein